MALTRQLNVDFFFGNLFGHADILKLVSVGSLNDIIYQMFFLNNTISKNLGLYLLYYKQVQLHLFY